MGKDNERRDVQYSVGKERLWPATHTELVDEQIAELQQRLLILENAHRALRQAVVALTSIVERKESPL